jgi:hypothetical protein
MPAPTITPLPTPPSRSTDPTNFAIEADAFVAALPDFATEANAQADYLDDLAVAVDADAAAAAADADIASAAATSALAAADVGLWVSGTTYAIGDNVISPISFQTYRRKTNGAGTTDPSLDATNWALLTFYPTSPFQLIGNATAGSEIRLPEDTDNGSNYVALKSPNALASNLTLTLPSADGSNGQFLSTDGAGGLGFATASSKYELIATVNASGASTVDFTGLSSTYAAYEVVMTGLYASTDILDLLVRTSSNNGVSFDSSAGNYAINYVLVNDSGGVSGASNSPAQINMGFIHSSSYGIYASLKLVNAGVSRPFGMEWTLGSYLSQIYHWRGVALRKSNTAVNAIRLFPSGGTITGTFKLYGIRA